MELIDPQSSGSRVERRMAARLDSLNNRNIGLLVNGKANADILAHETARFFEKRHGCQVIHFHDKRDASRPCDTDTLEQLSEVCDFLITTVGD